MPEPIAEALVLVLRPGMSLRRWEHLGTLDREWALYERLRPCFQTILLVTHGSRDDEHVASRLGKNVLLVANQDGLTEGAYAASVPARVVGALEGRSTVVVKSTHHPAAPIAVAIAAALRASKRITTAALLGRGGYLHSRFVALEFGAGSEEARRAGAEEAALCAAADLVVGTSRAMIDDLAWRHGLSQDAVRLVPNYVLGEMEPPAAAGREPGLVLYAGELTRRKRVDLIVEAMANLPEAMRSGALLRIIGEGPEEPRLRALARSQGVRSEFWPHIPHHELLGEMSRCSVYAQASLLEGHPKAVLEAMSVGAAVLVTDTPGLGDVVQQGVTGLRTDSDPRHFSQSLAALLSDLDWRESLGTAAARHVRSAFDLSRIVELEIDACRDALRRAAARATPGPPPADVGWEPDLPGAGPAVAADRWTQSLETFARRLSDSGRAELIARLETSLRQRGRSSAA